jgi:hypothetical protein
MHIGATSIRSTEVCWDSGMKVPLTGKKTDDLTTKICLKLAKDQSAKAFVDLSSEKHIEGRVKFN